MEHKIGISFRNKLKHQRGLLRTTLPQHTRSAARPWCYLKVRDFTYSNINMQGAGSGLQLGDYHPVCNLFVWQHMALTMKQQKSDVAATPAGNTQCSECCLCTKLVAAAPSNSQLSVKKHWGAVVLLAYSSAMVSFSNTAGLKALEGDARKCSHQILMISRQGPTVGYSE